MKEKNREYLDLFFNCNEHFNKRQCLDGIFTRVRQDTTTLSVDDLHEIRHQLIGYRFAILSQHFPADMDLKTRKSVEDFLILKSKQTDALVQKIYDIIVQKEKETL